MSLASAVRSEWRYDLALLALTRVGLIAVGLLATVLVPLGGRHLDLLPNLNWLDMWAQYDAQHYVNIAIGGYEPPTASFSNIAFFPLYPLLIRLVTLLVGGPSEQSAALAGVIISNVALFVALLYLSALVARDLSLSAARRSVLYVLVFPTTLFLSSVYAEPLFLATAAAALYHARAGEWYRAGAAGALAALTRPFGVLLAVPLLIELVRQRAPLRAWPSLAGPPLGLAAFIGYLWWLFDDPLAYFHAGASWGRGFHAAWDVLLGYLGAMSSQSTTPITLYDWRYAWIDLVAMLAMIVVLVAGVRRVPVSYSAYAASGLLFAMSTGVAWFSASRHALALFPLIIVMAVFGGRSRVFNYVWLAVSILLAAAFMFREAGGYWVT